MTERRRWLGTASMAVALVVVATSCAESADDDALSDREVDDGGAGPREPETSTATSVAEAPSWDGDDGFYPVQSTDPQLCPTTTGDDEPMVNSADGTCHVLDTASRLDTGIVESAEPEADQIGGFQVALVLTRPGAERFNELATLCYERQPECPTGQLAIVAEGQVVAAPTIQQAEFERGGIHITGELTEPDAASIAEALEG